MNKNKITLDSWMKKSRWSNTALAEAITNSGHNVSHSQISEIRNKRNRPSAALALAIYEFVNKEVPLEGILNEEIFPRAKPDLNNTITKPKV